MSGRPTADIIADLLDPSKIGGNRREAAERLAELEAREARWIRMHISVTSELTEVLRPFCPTCDGTKSLTNGDHCYENNGNCDGRVSVEKLAATWRAVHGKTLYDHMDTPDQADRFVTGWLAAHDHLRAVKLLAK